MRASYAIAVVVVAACSSGAVPEDARQELMDTDLAFAQEVAQGGVEAWTSYFAEDGMMFLSGDPVVGHEAIHALMEPVFADSTHVLDWRPRRAEVAASGDLGYTVGRYRSTRAGPNGLLIRGGGSYVTIWRKQPDGTWKVALDIGSARETVSSGSGD